MITDLVLYRLFGRLYDGANDRTYINVLDKMGAAAVDRTPYPSTAPQFFPPAGDLHHVLAASQYTQTSPTPARGHTRYLSRIARWTIACEVKDFPSVPTQTHFFRGRPCSPFNYIKIINLTRSEPHGFSTVHKNTVAVPGTAVYSVQ